jgi:PAS domain S-box-containing protein
VSADDKVRILLVDDQPARLLSYEAILEDLGHEIVKAGSGGEALQYLIRDEYAVILLDVNMQGMDGFETAALIHQHPRFERTPIIFVTAYLVNEMDRLRGYELGAVDYVLIPVIPQILRSKVIALVELYEQRRELARLNARLAATNVELAAANSDLQAEKARELGALNRTLEHANAELATSNATLEAQITERQRADEALGRSETRLRTILQATPALIYQMDEQCRFVHVNRQFEELVGLPLESLVGRHVAEFFRPEEAARMEANNRRVLEEGRKIEYEEVVRVDGHERVYTSVKSPVLDEAGRAVGIVGVSTDITERKRLESALKEADRRKDEFIAMLAHELRNPLAPIVNGLELMRMKAQPDPELAWVRDSMARQVGHLQRLVDDLLDVARITQGKLKLKREHIGIDVVVERAIETSRPLLEAREHALLVELPSDPVVVDGDLTRIAQALGNLLGNAAKYTPNGGNVWVTAACDDERHEVEIRVRDDGIGIPPEMLSRVFELFNQVESTLDRAQGGLGIGLALVQRVIELHGGSVEARSDGPGAGSEFVVRLPLARPGADVARAREESPPASAQPRRVLLVDDNKDCAESTALLLRLAAHEVRTVNDGPSALEAAEGWRPHVVVLDLGMSGMDGYETARRLRAQPWGKEMGLIALTGWSQSSVIELTRQIGFDAHLVKPVDRTVLLRALESVASTSPLTT